MDKFLSRKFLLACAALISLDCMLWFGKIDGSLWLTGLLATVGSYLTANYAVATKVT
jgi:hypothetical protein